MDRRLAGVVGSWNAQQRRRRLLRAAGGLGFGGRPLLVQGQVEQADGEVERAEEGWHQDVGVEGAHVDGAVAVDLEADAGVDAVEERAQEEPRAEERRRDGRPGCAPPRSRGRGRRRSAPGLRVDRSERSARWAPRLRRGAGGDEHGELGAHGSYLWTRCLGSRGVCQCVRLQRIWNEARAE